MKKFIVASLLFMITCGLDSASQGKITRLSDLATKNFEVVQLNSKTFFEFGVKPPRPYNLVVLFLASRRETQIYSKILNSFVKVAESYKAGQLLNKEKVFFSVIEYTKDSENLFKHLGVSLSSCLLITRPGFKLEDEKFIYPIEDLLKISSPSEAEATNLIRFLNYRLGEKVELQESVSEAILFLGFVMIACVGFGAFIYNLREFFMKPLVWYMFSVMIYFLCTSGIVYDLLREPGLYGNDGKGNKFIISQRQRTQYVFEGFLMSAILVIVGLSLVGVHVVRMVDDQIKMRIYASLMIFLMFFCLMNVRKVYRMKSSWYNPGFYPPDGYVRGPLSRDQGLVIGLAEDGESFGMFEEI